MIPFTWFEHAHERIGPHILNTPFTFDPEFNLFLKWENHQVTGSFKARGALNKILALQDWELERGLITASAGNHGQGVALAANIRHARVIVFASEHALPVKLQAMRELGAAIHLVPGGYAEAEQAGIKFARDMGGTWVSPYNDGLVIAGQGTVALEVVNEIPNQDSTTWIVPAGGGGLISGIGCVLQSTHPQCPLVAVQSEASAFLHEIYHQGTQAHVKEFPSLADGLAGPVEPGSVTIPIVKNVVTDFILVSEQEICKAIKFSWVKYHERIEGSAAVALAAVITGKVARRPAIVVMTGGNIATEDHASIIQDPSV